MKKLFICTCTLFLFAAGFYSCDTTSAPEKVLEEAPVLDSFRVIPSSVNFSPESGFTDTTLVFSIEATIPNSGIELNNPYAVITDKNNGEILTEIDLPYVDSRTGLYAADFEIFTSTSSYEDYVVNFIYDQSTGSYAQTSIQIEGFSNNPPTIIETESPGTINRPPTGEKPAIFLAKVTDLDGQKTIDKVYIRVISQMSGEVTGSPFEMFDDGSSFNDEESNDSTFTWIQQITPTESNPNRDYDIEFFAIDKGGLSSDTIRTTFHIRE